MRIQKVKEGLYTSIIVSPSGNLVHLAFEKINADSYRFWREYNNGFAKRSLEILKNIASRHKSADNLKSQFAEVFKMNFEQYEAFLENDSKLMEAVDSSGVPSGMIGLREALKPFEYAEAEQAEKTLYMVYASKVPVRDYSFNMYSFKKEFLTLNSVLQDFQRYQNIIMQFSLTTGKTSESTSHMGIYKNPMSFLDPSDKFAGISVLLHGFAAECSKEILHKKIQVNKPTQIMVDLIVKAVGKEFVSVDEDGTKGLAKLNHVTNVHGLLIGVELQHLAGPFQKSYDKLKKTTTPLENMQKDLEIESNSYSSSASSSSNLGTAEQKRTLTNSQGGTI